MNKDDLEKTNSLQSSCLRTSEAGARAPRFTLTQKLIISLVGSMAVLFGALGYQTLRIQRQNLEQMTHLMADRISRTIGDSTRYSMLQNHRDEVYHIIRTISAKQGIKTIRIFNKEGKISYSTNAHELNTFVDKQAEACYACHSQEHPLSHLDRPDRMRTYMGPGNERILGLITAIENEPACSNASCHAHSADQRVLGVLDVSISLAGVDQMIAQGQKRMALDFVFSIAVISLVFTWVILILIHRPIKRLISGTKQVASGMLDYKIDVPTHDEMGELAASFNEMTSRLKDAREELTGWAKTLELRVAEKTDQLKRANEQMIQIERMASIGKLSAIVAHEINNPLAGILTYSKLLLKRVAGGAPNAEHMQRELEMIAAESARCGEIVKSLLQFTRQSAPRLHLHDVNEIVKQSIRLVQHKMDLTGVKTQFLPADDLPALYCDEQQIKQALVALLINACEAVHAGEGVLELSTAHDVENHSVQIRIKDNGVGMDEETQRHIFEPFFTTKDSKGMGLGLAVVYGIVSRHSGAIQVHSAPGRGAEFVIDLPETIVEKTPDEVEERSVVLS